MPCINIMEMILQIPGKLFPYIHIISIYSSWKEKETFARIIYGWSFLLQTIMYVFCTVYLLSLFTLERNLGPLTDRRNVNLIEIFLHCVSLLTIDRHLTKLKRPERRWSCPGDQMSDEMKAELGLSMENQWRGRINLASHSSATVIRWCVCGLDGIQKLSSSYPEKSSPTEKKNKL